jgi:YggT family protein
VLLVGQILYGILWFFIALLWVRFIIDWVQVFARNWRPGGALLVVLEVVYSITDPPIKLVRRWLPTLRIGSVALDLSFLVVMIVAWLLLQVVVMVFLR